MDVAVLVKVTKESIDELPARCPSCPLRLHRQRVRVHLHAGQQLRRRVRVTSRHRVTHGPRRCAKHPGATATHRATRRALPQRRRLEQRTVLEGLGAELVSWRCAHIERRSMRKAPRPLPTRRRRRLLTRGRPSRRGFVPSRGRCGCRLRKGCSAISRQPECVECVANGVHGRGSCGFGGAQITIVLCGLLAGRLCACNLGPRSSPRISKSSTEPGATGLAQTFRVVHERHVCP